MNGNLKMEKSETPRKITSSTPHEDDLKIFYNIFNIEKNETIIHVFDCICNAQRKKNFKGKLFISEKGAYFFHEHFSVVMLNKYIRKVKKRFFTPGKFSIKVYKPELNKVVEFIFSAVDGDRDLIVNIIQQLRENPSSFLEQQAALENIVSSPPTRLSSHRELSLPSSEHKKKTGSPQEPKKDTRKMKPEPMEDDVQPGSAVGTSTFKLEVAQNINFEGSEQEGEDDEELINDDRKLGLEDEDYETPDEVDDEDEMDGGGPLIEEEEEVIDEDVLLSLETVQGSQTSIIEGERSNIVLSTVPPTTSSSSTSPGLSRDHNRPGHGPVSSPPVLMKDYHPSSLSNNNTTTTTSTTDLSSGVSSTTSSSGLSVPVGEEGILPSRSRVRKVSNARKTQKLRQVVKSIFVESKFERMRDIPTTKYHFDARTKDYNPKKLTDRTINVTMQEFLKYISQEDFFIRRFHASRNDLDLKMSPWERHDNDTFERSTSFLMNVKLPFSSKTHQPITDHMRLTVLKGGKKVVWEHSFAPSGFFGSDCLYLLGQVVITEVEKRKVRVVVGAGPVYIKPLNILFKWKFNSVSMNILTDCFRMIDLQFSIYEKEIRENHRKQLSLKKIKQQQQRIKGHPNKGGGPHKRKRSNGNDVVVVGEEEEVGLVLQSLEIPRVNNDKNHPPAPQGDDDDDEEDDMFSSNNNNNKLEGSSSLLNLETVLAGSKQVMDYCQKNVSLPYVLVLIILMILISVFFRLRRMEGEIGKIRDSIRGEFKSDFQELLAQVNEGRIEFEKKWSVFQKDGIEMERNWNSFERRYLDFEKEYLRKVVELVDQQAQAQAQATKGSIIDEDNNMSSCKNDGGYEDS